MKNTKKFSPFPLMLALFIALAGCGPVKEQGSPPTESVTPKAIEYTPVSTEYVFLADSVWKDVPILQLDAELTYPLAISAEGDFVYNVISGENDKYQTLYIRNLYSGEPEQIARVETPEQIFLALINERWIVWEEQLYGDGFGDGSCAVWAYERSSKTTRPVYIADSKANADNISWMKSPKPSLKGDKVLLDTLMAVDENKQLSINSYEYDLITGEKALIAEQMLCPEYQEDCIIAVGQDTGYSENGLSIINRVRDGEITPLTDSGMVVREYITDGHSGVLFTGQSALPVVADKITRNLYLIENGKTSLLREHEESGSGCCWPALNERAAVWRENNALLVYDRSLKQTISLTAPDQFTGGALATDDYIVWTYNSEESISAGIRKLDSIGIIAVKDLPLT